MPDIRVTIDATNHRALRQMALASGLTLKRLVEITLIDLLNKRSPKLPALKPKP